jgi:hypothetical protein
MGIESIREIKSKEAEEIRESNRRWVEGSWN